MVARSMAYNTTGARNAIPDGPTPGAACHRAGAGEAYFATALASLEAGLAPSALTAVIQ